jgi:hypothetical protein
MDYQIRCKVFPGQFSSEYAVKAEQVNGEAFSLFAPVSAVETDEPPTRDRAVDGWLAVAIWNRRARWPSSSCRGSRSRAAGS